MKLRYWDNKDYGYVYSVKNILFEILAGNIVIKITDEKKSETFRKY